METLSCSSRSKLDFDDGNLNSEQKGSQIQRSSIPVIPVRPNLPIPHLIYLNRQENHETGEKSEGFITGFCKESCLEMNGDVNRWEIALAGKLKCPGEDSGGDSGVNGQVCFCAMDRWNNKPWIDFPFLLQMTQCVVSIPSSSETQIAPITLIKGTNWENADKIELQSLIDEAIGLDTTTLQQKPRRRKHRPKVITEGKQPKRRIVATPTPSKENSTGKRKHGRDKELDKTTKTPPSELIRDVSDQKTVESRRKSARKALNFEFDDRKKNESFANTRMGNDEMGMQRLRAKEKYVRNEAKKLRWGEDFASRSYGDSKYQTRLSVARQKDSKKLIAHTRLGKDKMEICQVHSSISKYQTRQPKGRRKNCAHVLVMEGSSSMSLSEARYKALNLNGLDQIDDFKNRVSCKPQLPRVYQRRPKKEHNDKLSVNNGSKVSTLVNGVAQGDEALHGAQIGEKVGFLESSSRNLIQLHQKNFMPIGSSMEAKRNHNTLVNVVTESLRYLDIEEKNPLFFQPSNARYQSENALVVYKKDGTIVHFDGSFFPIKRRRPRPKVNLDEETTRVWKLLLENISNEGIDGSDEKNAKQWEEERNVFRGRADSFIARMHLVQGDRRFSQWKGSVLDSVIGVFLTQNVSDHLSSSAFMSLASHFPLKPDSSVSFGSNPCTPMENGVFCQRTVESSMDETVESQDSTIGSSSSLLELLQIAIDPEFNKDGLYETLMKEFDTSLGDSYDKQSQSFSGEISNVTESSGGLCNRRKVEENGLEPSLKQGNRSEKRKRAENEKIKVVDWDSLRKQAQANGVKERTANTRDSVDWEAVRNADVDEVAHTIRERGMNNRLAERIKDFLDRLVRDHQSLDLEWIRDIPPDTAKEFLLSFRGLGLKSVECVRLLTLHQLAFPVDTNVGRIAVRLGWVPLQPLPESLQLHLLELYPVMESIQKYLWPRLCKLDQRTLYELHYQMITFGKVFCTKTKPNCNACPMRGDCRHFASAFASARLALPGPEEKSVATTTEQQKTPDRNHITITTKLQLPPPHSEPNQPFETETRTIYEPIIEEPVTPEPECPQILECDMEDLCLEDPDEIPMIKLDIEEFAQNLQAYVLSNMELQEGHVSRALVALTPEAASIPAPKLKYINRLRTEHQVYELPDSHPLVKGLEKREPDDPCSYLLAIWTPGETANSIHPPEGSCSSREDGNFCSETMCFSCNSVREANSQTVRGTLLIPCRTAMRGSFPLNGTYFQVNEVFADHDSSISPIDVPRDSIWNLPRRTVFFGTSIPAIFRGQTTEAIQYCFWRGKYCFYD